MATDLRGNRSSPSIWDLCDRAKVSERARRCVKSNMTPAALMEKLVESELYVDAILLVSHALPKREAIWWGCLCLEMVAAKDDSPKEVEALGSAVRWVIDPSELNRRMAGSAADVADRRSPAGSLARAAFWTGGSVSRIGQPEVPPGDSASATALSAAVRLAWKNAKSDERDSLARSFLRLALEVAEGRHSWSVPQATKGVR